MYIINTVTKEIVCEILTNHSMTLDEAIELVGEFIDTENFDDADVMIHGKEYWSEELDVTTNPDLYFGE